MKEPVTAGSDRGSENCLLIPMPEKAWAQMWEKTGPLDALTEFLAGCLKRVEGMGRPEEMRVMVCVPQMKEPVGERDSGSTDETWDFAEIYFYAGLSVQFLLLYD